jgi:hypothetical protein
MLLVFALLKFCDGTETSFCFWVGGSAIAKAGFSCKEKSDLDQGWKKWCGLVARVAQQESQNLRNETRSIAVGALSMPLSLATRHKSASVSWKDPKLPPLGDENSI